MHPRYVTEESRSGASAEFRQNCPMVATGRRLLGTRGTEDIDVSYEETPSLERIAAAWTATEAIANPSFFLTWHWVGCWLRVSGLEPDLLIAGRSGKPVGLALICRRRDTWRDRWIPMLTLTSHEGAFASPFIEYNGFLIDREDREHIANAMAAKLSALPRFLGRRGWVWLSLPGVDDSVVEILTRGGLIVKDVTQRPSPYIDLDAIRKSEKRDYLSTRSSNFRGTVRRSIRMYQETGPLALEAAQTIEDAFSAYEELKTLHQRQWLARGRTGAFSCPFFDEFHRALIADSWPAGKVDLLRLKVADRTVGCLYNFLHGDKAYAYQSGFEFSPDARLKPGLVSHALAAQRYLNAGTERYLLLAGESRFKRSLATDADMLHWAIARRPGALVAALDIGGKLIRLVPKLVRARRHKLTAPKRSRSVRASDVGAIDK